jgi:hypothetical protein
MAQQWQYKVIKYQSFQDATHLEMMFNEYGADGWDLIHVQVSGSSAKAIMRKDGPAPAAGAPVNTAPPTIPATAIVGATINCSPGTWTGGSVQMAFKWKRNGITISGETLPSYVTKGPDAGKQLTCDCTATNSSGSATAVSNGCSVT